MNGQCLLVPNSTVYRNISDELVVIQLDTGKFFYFTADTKDFLDYFQQPRSLNSYFESVKGEDSDEDYLKGFCDFLLKNGILQNSNEVESENSIELEHSHPKFLREGEKTLDEITFLCP